MNLTVDNFEVTKTKTSFVQSRTSFLISELEANWDLLEPAPTQAPISGVPADRQLQVGVHSNGEDSEARMALCQPENGPGVLQRLLNVRSEPKKFPYVCARVVN